MLSKNYLSLLPIILPLLLSPLLLGVINRTKAKFAGRVGSPLLQTYYDLYRLLKKDFIYSKSTSWVIRMGSWIILAATISVLSLLPLPGIPTLVSFKGDLLLFIYLLALTRFIIIVSALDTGSSFEGMGSAREAFFGLLAEPVIFLILITLAIMGHTFSLSGIFSAITTESWPLLAPELVLLVLAWFVILLLESCRIPFDDPNTHLELTMIHEVMVLDHAGFDLGLILYANSLKLWFFSSIVVQIIIPSNLFNLVGITSGSSNGVVLSVLTHVLGILLVAVLIGVVESTMARLRINRVPNLILGAFSLSLVAFILLWKV